MSRADTQEDLNAVIRQHSELLAAQLHSQRESLFPPDASKSMRKFTSGEAAALLGVNDSYLRKLHLDGKGPSPEVSSGNRRHYSAEDIQNLRVLLEKTARKPGDYLPGRRAGDHLQIIGVMNFKGGSGKTTSLRMLCGLLTPDAGEGTCLGFNIRTEAEAIKLTVPLQGPFTSLLTAVHADAPPILQWDLPEARNPVSWYFYNGGSSALSYSLHAGSQANVRAIALKPSAWQLGFSHFGSGVMFVLEGARDTRRPSLCLFPEILKSEFHGIRSVIEAYSLGASIEGLHEPHAAGVMLTKGDKAWQATVRVWSGGKSLDYCLDRWD